MPIRHARTAFAAFAALLIAALPAPLRAQPVTTAGTGLTLLASPPGARVAISGTSSLSGPSPLELPAGWSGRHSVRVGAPNYATGQGVIAIPSSGAPYSLSEAPGLSAGLIVRSLNLPGFPAMSSGHKARGLLFLAGAAGAGFGAAQAQMRHDDDTDLGTVTGDDEAADHRLERDRWLGYGGGVWALSALDYMVRARVRIQEATPQRVTLGVPKVTRGGMFWRSMLAPGAGQEFANQRGRGLLWLSATLATGAAVVIAERSVDVRRTEVEWTRSLLDSAGPSEHAVLLDQLGRQQGSLENSRNVRDGFLTALAAVYAANLLDALIAPIRRDDGPGPPRVTLDAPIDSRRAALALSYRF